MDSYKSTATGLYQYKKLMLIEHLNCAAELYCLFINNYSAFYMNNVAGNIALETSRLSLAGKLLVSPHVMRELSTLVVRLSQGQGQGQFQSLFW